MRPQSPPPPFAMLRKNVKIRSSHSRWKQHWGGGRGVFQRVLARIADRPRYHLRRRPVTIITNGCINWVLLRVIDAVITLINTQLIHQFVFRRPERCTHLCSGAAASGMGAAESKPASAAGLEARPCCWISSSGLWLVLLPSLPVRQPSKRSTWHCYCFE